jgi:hypothetical protein
MPVSFAERPAFYREQLSATAVVEIPYLILSSLCFTLPFFYIVGFQNVGHTSGKFGYYWLFVVNRFHIFCIKLVHNPVMIGFISSCACIFGPVFLGCYAFQTVCRWFAIRECFYI